MALALEGIKILDLSRYAPGPYCTMILGDLGADIIKIDEVAAPEGRRAERAGGVSTVVTPKEFAPLDSPYNPLNRNKRSLQLNLKTAAGQRIFYELAKKSDVVVEGFRPGVMKRLGIDYLTLKEKNERLIYCAITGYGQDGPYRDLPGHDINYLACGGAVNAVSMPGVFPSLPGNLIADMGAGGLQAAVGILAAIIARDRTGKGQFIDISMTDGVVNLTSLYLSRYFQTGTLPSREERASCGGVPYYNYYETSDGKFIAIACSEPWFYTSLCQVMDCERYIPYQHDAAKYPEIAAWFKQKFLSGTRDEWFDRLAKADIPASKVLALDELAFDPQIQARQMLVEVDNTGGEKVRQAGISIKLLETRGKIRNAGTRPGGSTHEILSNLGYSGEAIIKLKTEGIIGTGE